MRSSSLFAFAALCWAVPLVAQPQPKPAAAAVQTVPFVASEADEVVARLADSLESDFVLPDVGKSYAAMLRQKLAAGAYRNSASADAFAAAVTADLAAVHHDAHLKLFAPKPAGSGERRQALAPGTASTITASGWIAPGVAYIAFDAFYGNDATLSDLRAFLAKVKGAKTLIIDARHHRGGGMDEMDVLFPELFEKKTGLVDMDARESVEKRLNDAEDSPTLERVAGPESVIRRRHFAIPSAHPALGDAKVYVLTSHFSASAAEHLALALKRTHRATVIGETTRGAGNFGFPLSLNNGYSAFVPFGRTFDPDTNEGWEGTGVKPTIEVPADKALDEALKLAGVKSNGAASLASLR